MSNIEKFPRDAIEAHDAVMASANTMAATIQTIATTHVEYTRKTIQDGTDFLTKLTSLQSPDRAIGLQTEFAGKSYQAFVQEMRKISELYVDLLEHACKPFEAFANHSFANCWFCKSLLRPNDAPAAINAAGFSNGPAHTFRAESDPGDSRDCGPGPAASLEGARLRGRGSVPGDARYSSAVLSSCRRLRPHARALPGCGCVPASPSRASFSHEASAGERTRMARAPLESDWMRAIGSVWPI
jgi:phasin family protein